MPIPPPLAKAAGSYNGKSVLYMPWLEEAKQLVPSDSTLNISLHKEYALVNYTWADSDKKPQEGHMIISAHEEKSVAAWLDSWHMTFPILNCEGTASPLKFTGNYSGGDEVWRWRIELTPNDAGIHMEMVNITPDGEETWAVRADYHRV